MKKVTIQILDKRIDVEMDVEEDYLKELIRILENEVWKVRSKVPALSFEKLLLIASLNLVDKFIKEKKEMENNFIEKINQIIGTIEKEI